MASWWDRFQGRGQQVVEASPAPSVDVEAVRSEAFAAGRAAATEEITNGVIEQARLLPVAAPSPVERSAYAMGTPSLFATQHRPSYRPLLGVNVGVLIALADNYDIARSCINHLKREMQTIPIEVVPRDEKDKSDEIKRRCDEAMALFEDKGPVGEPGVSYGEFETELVSTSLWFD